MDELSRTMVEASAQLRALTEQRSNFHRRLVDAQEQERLRLSRELHDETAQCVAAALLEVKRIERRSEEQGPKQANQLRAHLERIGQILQRVARELRPPAIDDLGLLDALADLLNSWGRQTGILPVFHCSAGRLDFVPQEMQTTIYRVVQEALTNVTKHATGATAVTVNINVVQSDVRLVIEDNGAGADFTTSPAGDVSPKGPGGLGLLGMRERLSLLGGELQVESAPGRGTTLYVRIPLEPLRVAV